MKIQEYQIFPSNEVFKGFTLEICETIAIFFFGNRNVADGDGEKVNWINSYFRGLLSNVYKFDL